jgi:hypothetical protein
MTEARRQGKLTSKLTTVAILVVAFLSACGAALAAPPSRLTLYAVPTTVQFMNHADDRLRGMTTNPFASAAQGQVIASGANEKKAGPFPGDDVLYSFDLYTKPARGKRLGSAIFTCYYDFGKHAVCDSYFDLDGGLILGSGSVALGNPRFVLSVTGGTRTYLGALGQVTSVPAPKNTQRYDLQLIGLRK